MSHTHTQYWQYLRIWVCWCRHILAPGPKYVSSCSQHISAISVTKILSLFESRESLQQNYKQRHTYRRASFMKSVRAHCRNHWNGKCMCVTGYHLAERQKASTKQPTSTELLAYHFQYHRSNFANFWLPPYYEREACEFPSWPMYTHLHVFLRALEVCLRMCVCAVA